VFLLINILKNEQRPVADGFKITLIELLLAVLITIIYIRIDENKVIFDKSIILLNIFAIGLIFKYLISMIQLPAGLKDTYHSYFVINEILSVESRVFPLYNYSSQYTNILPYVFKILSSFLNLDDLYYYSTIFLIALQFLIIVMLSMLIKEFTKLKYLLILVAIWLILPFSKVDLGEGSSLIGYFQVFPIRLVGPVILLFTANYLFKDFKTSFLWIKAFILGAVNCFVVLNNIDFGVLSCIVIYIVLIIISKGRKDYQKFIIASLISTSIFLIFTFLIFSASGHKIDFKLMTQFISIFGVNGFYAFPLPLFGFYWLYLLSTLFIFLYSFTEFLKQDKNKPINHQVIVLLIISLYLMTFFSYYVNRSLDPTLTTLFLFWIFGVMYFYLYMRAFHKKEFRKSYVAFLCIFILSLGFMKIDNRFSVGFELRRLEGAQLTPRPLNLSENELYIKSLVKKLGQNNTYKIGYISTTSEIDSVRMSLNNAFSYNSVSSIMVKDQIDSFCLYHKYKSPFKYILIKDLELFPNGLDRLLICNNWMRISDDEQLGESLSLFEIYKG
jgi:hypothetical protein